MLLMCVHEEMIVRVINVRKHVICEKSLSGYLGQEDDEKPIGISLKESSSPVAGERDWTGYKYDPNHTIVYFI